MSRVLLPSSLNEMWDLLHREPEALIFAGGTDLLVKRREGIIDGTVLIGLERISEIRGVRDEGGQIWIGAGSTHTRLLNEPLVQHHLPVLIQALRTLGSPPIRNMGTIGGNICTASPAGDTLPPLYVLDTSVVLQSADNVREVPIGTFITGPGKTGLNKGEILTGVRVKKPLGYTLHHYEKVGQRRALACCVAGMAALIKVSPSGIIEAAKLAWGSVAPTVAVFPDVEASLIGRPLSPTVLEEAAVVVRKAVTPIDDVRASADYRRLVAGNLLLRLSAVNPSS
ncbi:MAG: Nicotinate dehydrogenase FAD-subunit [Syntrophus sp. SKADARSKE-3]|nr:Nicotinate dehydrogenase FAD-subunit [Syntrophus sp. SKADARSKE-3]